MEEQIEKLRQAEVKVSQVLEIASADAKKLAKSEDATKQDFVAGVKEIHALLSESIVAIAEAKAKASAAAASQAAPR